jgi:heavy metal sensor kinase
LTLTSRLTLFFLVTLAAVLTGFSATLYLLARAHLHQQAEERLDAALNTLVASIEVKPGKIEWEPDEHFFNLGAAAEANQIVWIVGDDRGRILDHSKQSGVEVFLGDAANSLQATPRATLRRDWRDESWTCGQRTVGPFRPAGPNDSPTDTEAKYPNQMVADAMSVTAGVSLEPARSTLGRLAWTLGGLSLAVWLVALVGGRLVCRQALLPVTRMAGSARDMTVDDLGQRLPVPTTGDELEELSRAFNSLLDRLQESFQRQKRFTGDASHQLRTPLTAMIGQIEVALRRERSTEEYRRVLNAVHHNAGNMRQIVESLLFLARANSEARQPERERIDLQDWLPAHLQTWSAHARAQDMVLERDAADPKPVDVQPVLLGELMNILIDNACKFSQAGTPIRLRLSRKASLVSIQVQDDGPGISDADLLHIFTPFFRAQDARLRGVEGTGLGLAIAKRLAGVFGGTLTVTSQLGRGSCFTLTLPAAAHDGQRVADAAEAV